MVHHPPTAIILWTYLGCRLARPPGGRDEHPVVNCRNAFLSAPVIDTKTLTNLRKPGDSLVYPSLGSVYLITSSLVKTGSWSPHNIHLTSSGVKLPSFSSGNTELKPCLRFSSCDLTPRINTQSSVLNIKMQLIQDSIAL